MAFICIEANRCAAAFLEFLAAFKHGNYRQAHRLLANLMVMPRLE